MNSSTGQGASSNANRAHRVGFVAHQTPSGQKKRGDQRLRETSALVEQYGPGMDPTDRRLIEQKIIHANEVKSGVDSKSLVPRYLQAREYRKVAENAYQSAMTASERVRDSALTGHRYDSQPLSGPTLDHVISVARSLYRCNLACKDAFPSSKKKAEWATGLWADACTRTTAYPCPPSQPELFAVSSMHLVNEMKTKIMHAVETFYGFDTSQAPRSISHNANLAYTMLTRMTFIYRDYNHDGPSQLPYRHPIVQKAINITWFEHKDADGVIFHEYFSTMPIPAIALVLMVIECCIDEWSQGIRRQSSWSQEHFYNAYRSHINSLTDFSRHHHSQGQLEQIQKDLFKYARQHSGTTPDPVTASGRFTSGDLDARQYDTLPPYSVPQYGAP